MSNKICRPAKEFKFEDFSEFKIVKTLSCIITKNEAEYPEKKLIRRCRQFFAKEIDLDEFKMRVVSDFGCNRNPELQALLESPDEVWHFLSAVQQSGFIRKDNYKRNVRVTCFLEGEPLYETFKIFDTCEMFYCEAFDESCYEHLELISDEQFEKISQIIKENLSPTQRDLILFFILRSSSTYEYTDQEQKTLFTAISNLRSHEKEIKQIIHQA